MRTFKQVSDYLKEKEQIGLIRRGLVEFEGHPGERRVILEGLSAGVWRRIIKPAIEEWVEIIEEGDYNSVLNRIYVDIRLFDDEFPFDVFPQRRFYGTE